MRQPFCSKESDAYDPNTVTAQTVMLDDIVRELAKDRVIAPLYAEWNHINREKLSLYYDKIDGDIPLEENTEFRSIKNVVIQTAAAMDPSSSMSDVAPTPQTALTLANLVARLLRLISDSYQNKEKTLHGQIDGKLRSKIAQKKAAHGIRTNHNQSGGDQTMS